MSKNVPKTAFNLDKELKILKFDIKVRDLQTNFNREINSIKEQIDNLVNNDEKYDQFIREIKQCIETYFELIENTKLRERNEREEARISDLQEKIHKLKLDEQNEKDLAKQKKLEEIQALERDMQIREAHTKDEHKRLIKEYETKLEQLQDYRDKYEMEIKHELCELKESYEKKLFNLRNMNHIYKIESSLLNRKLAQQEISLQEFIKENEAKEHQVKLFSSSNVEQEKIEKYLQENLTHGDQMAALNENKVAELRAKCADLEKFNFVHKFTYDVLLKQKQPIKQENRQISEINEKIRSEILSNDKKILRLNNEISIINNKIRLVNNKANTMQSLSQVNSTKNQRIIQTLFVLNEKVNYENAHDLTKTKLIQEAIDEIRYLLKYDRASYFTKVNRQYNFLKKSISKQMRTLEFNRKTTNKRLEKISLQKLRHHASFRQQTKEINEMAKKTATLAKVEHFMKKHNVKRIDEFVDELMKTKMADAGNENEIIKENEMKILELKRNLLKMNDLMSNRVDFRNSNV